MSSYYINCYKKSRLNSFYDMKIDWRQLRGFYRIGSF